MKIFLLFFSFFLLLNSYAQNYAPFNAKNPKRFQNSTDQTDNQYFFYPVQTDTINDTIVFRQYFQKSTTLINVNGTYCGDISWGGGNAPVADTSWLGQKIRYDLLNQKLIFLNSSDDTLNFNFGIPLGDSALFYQNINENWYLKYESINQELVIDSNEFVKIFTIWKYDDLGMALNSTLNGFEIKLSQNLGLVRFINCTDFPTLEQGFSLMGQLHPTIGHYQMTFDEAFPWQTGDILQLKGKHGNSQLMVSTSSYKFLNITNRIETTDSVWIYYDSTEQFDYYPPGGLIQWYPSSYNWTYSNPIVFRKGNNIIETPHNMTSYDGYTFTADSTTICGMKNRISFSNEFVNYCDSCNCLIVHDGFTQYIEDRSYVEQIGMSHQQIMGDPSNFEFFSADLIYSNINGVECGTQAFVSIEELTLNVGVKPNPTNDKLEISSSFEINSLEVLNSQGSTCFSENPHKFDATISIGWLVPGIYFLQVKGEQGQKKIVKIVKI